jgi:AbrB family looped-hinge helix DNA binding protein
MTDVIADAEGQVPIPSELRQRYGLRPRSKVRVVETRGGILLIPLTDEPMDADLKSELDLWTKVGAESVFGWEYHEGNA